MELRKTLYSCEDHIATVTLNSPENLNAINLEMAEELLHLMQQCDENPDVYVVVITGGMRAFSAGGDINFLYKTLQSTSPRSSGLAECLSKLAVTIKTMKKLVITSVCGPAAGAGASLALLGDFCIAADNAKIIQSFAGVALVPDTGGTYLLAKMIGSRRALDLVVSARPVKADEALALGIVNSVCPVEELEAETLKLARRLARGPRLSYQNIKRQMYAASFSDLEDYFNNVELDTIGECRESEDFREGVFAFVEKRRPAFKGK